MAATIGNLLLFVIAIICTIVWIKALADWDGEKPCNPEDCESCPFPPCEGRDAPKNNISRKDKTS